MARRNVYRSRAMKQILFLFSILAIVTAFTLVCMQLAKVLSDSSALRITLTVIAVLAAALCVAHFARTTFSQLHRFKSAEIRAHERVYLSQTKARDERFAELRSQTFHVAELRAMDPGEFEHFIADIYKRQGYEAEVTPLSHDGGIDIILTDADKKTIAVQTKRYRDSNTIGRKLVQEFFGAYITRHHRGIFVITSYFTPHAREEATLNNVTLIDFPALQRMIRESNLT